MKLFSWSNYKDTEITEKTKYWVDLWEETVEGFSNYVYDKDLVNPHLLLIYLIEEIKYNKLMNVKNNNYFIEKLNFFVKNDLVIKNLFKTDFILLIGELSSKYKRFEYFRILCEEIINVFQKGIYFKESCNQLKKIILDTQWKDSDENEIFLISQSLIIELILTEYNLETIKTIPRGLFDKYDILDTGNGELISSKYPTSLNIKDFYEDGKLNQILFNEALKTEINSLNVSDRVERLKYYFDKELFEGYGIFHIEGVKGNIDVNVGEVNFYSPKIENYWRVTKNPKIKTNNFDEKKLEFVDDEEPYSVGINKAILFRDFESKVKQTSFINAAVKIKYRDFESARIKALEIVEKSLDILRLHVVSEIPFRVKPQRFYLVNCEDLRVSDSFSARDTLDYKEMVSYNLNNSTLFSEKNEKYLTGLKKLLFNEDIEKYTLSAKLAYSLHWYRKAFETDLPEDQLLSYWIAIENLLTFDSKNGNLVLRDQEEKDKFILVQELVPFIELHHSIKNVAVDTYWYLKKLIYNSQISSFTGSTTKTLDIPQNCLEACQLEHRIERKDIDLIKFIQTLPLLYPHITRKAVENKIKYCEKFYNDTQFKSSELQRKLEQTKKDLLLIYRYRNLIVHNARFDNKILPYYVKKAENLAGNLLRTVLYEHTMDSTKFQQEILIYEKVRMEIIIEKLGKSEHVDFWEL